MARLDFRVPTSGLDVDGNITVDGNIIMQANATVDGVDVSALATTANSALQNVVEDLTPQLGGALDVNGQEITGAIDLHSTGSIILELGDALGAQKVSIRDSGAVEVFSINSDGAATGSGSGLTNLNASNLASGTVPTARVSGSYTGITGTGTLAAGSITTTFGDINIGTSTFTGNGSGLTTLNASNLSSGTVDSARVSGSYTGITGTGPLNAGSITSGFGNIDNGASSITTTGTISGGTVTVSGDVAVNGGDLTTTATTFNLVNATATTVNFGGAATALNIGNASGTVTFANDVTITGDLIVNGTTTTVNSTVVTIDDPVFTLGGDTAPGSDDGKDRGIEFRWHNGTAAKVGFFGFDDSSGRFTFIPDATNTSEVFSGTKGALDVGSLFVDDIEVDTTGATTSQVLQYDGTKFAPATLSSASSFTTIAVSGQSDVVADSASDTLTFVAGSGITLTTDAGADSVTFTNSGALNAFTTIAVSGQSSVVADSASDTLTLVAGSNITITTNAASDTVTITGPTPGGLAFGTVAVSGQSDVVADSTSDTLTFVNGTGVTVTTNATNDSVTFGIGQDVATTSNVTFGSVSTSATENGGTATTLQRSSYDATTSTTQKVIESHAVSGHTTVKYLIQAVQGTSTVSTEILAVYNNSTVNYTEYATVLVGTLPATFEVTYSNSAIELKATAASSSSTTYRVFSTAIAA